MSEMLGGYVGIAVGVFVVVVVREWRGYRRTPELGRFDWMVVPLIALIAVLWPLASLAVLWAVFTEALDS